MIEFEVSHHHSGQRLDRLFRKVFPTLSLSKIHSTLRKKKVRLNGVRAKVETMVEKGDKVQIYEFFPDPLFDKSSSWGDLGVLSKKLNVLDCIRCRITVDYNFDVKHDLLL